MQSFWENNEMGDIDLINNPMTFEKWGHLDPTIQGYMQKVKYFMFLDWP